jgi:hypothetical protein
LAKTPKERLNKTNAKNLITRLYQSWENAKTNIARSQERYAKQANKHRQEPDFAVKDKVWVLTKPWKTDRPSKKLADQIDRPYEIIKQISYSYRLCLPESIKVHLVFHVDRLLKAPENPLPGQFNAPLPPL